MRNILVAGLLLPIKIYFQPLKFRAEVASFVPDLPEDYSLWQARHKLRDAKFRRKLAELFAQAMLSLLWSLAICLAIQALGVEISWLGVALGVAVGVAFGVAVGVASVLTATHLLNLLIQWPQVIVSGLIARNAPHYSRALWRISPVRWDDVILLPLPGLVTLLTILQRQYPLEGEQSLKEVAAHRYQRKAAHQVLARLAQEDAQQITSLQALASYEHGLNWLSETVLLPNEERQRLLKMRDISREVASAQESDSATNRVRRLESAQGTLDALRANPGEFGQVLTTWSSLVAAALETARQRQRIEEPIPQIYAQDGRAIAPENRRDDEVPFKGRRALITQLELALGGRVGERSTLLLYGQRRTGKTSVLLQLPRRLGSQFVPVFVDLQSGKFGANDAEGYLRGLADVIADEALAKRNLVLPRLNRRALAKDAYPAWDGWLEDVERMLDQRTLLICLDEFEALEEAIQAGRIDERLLNLLRHVTQHRHSISVLLSGSHQIDELPSHWAKALVGTTVLPISFLDEADARELIDCPVKDFPDLYTAEAIDEIIRVTHCQPYYIQLLCAQLVERMNHTHRLPPASRVTLDDVQAVIPIALERGQGYFSDLWQNQVGTAAGRQILEALAKSAAACLKVTDIRARVPDDATRRAALDTLKRRELIEIANDECRICVPLIAEYVRQRTMM